VQESEAQCSTLPPFENNPSRCLALPSRPLHLRLIVASCPKSSRSLFQLKLFPTPILVAWGATPVCPRAHCQLFDDLTPNSESTLVTPPGRSSTKKDGQRDPDAVFGALSSTYGWGGVHVPALPSDPAAPSKSKKTPAVKSAATQQDAAAPAPSTPHKPLRRPLTQAQREQAIVDLSSRYGHASPLPGGRWKI
jgi:hypothetical protein